MNSVVIRVDNLSKRYKIGALKYRPDTVRDHLTEGVRSMFRRNGRRAAANRESGTMSQENFWALENVSFEVRRGEVIGVIGRNGAGKSTLLKILSRITEPTSGSVKIHGRVASLLEVGTGFHGELSGRENVYFNGAILGMKKAEIDRKFDDIVAFSEVERFIDTPVKRYSSGMYVRLAFAVAAHLEPEILIVDEVLAVGDVAFQKKCLGKMDEIANDGRTVFLVSHNMASIEHLCHKAIVLEKGKLVFDGGAKEAVDYYIHSTSGESQASTSHIIDLTAAPGRSRKLSPILKRLELFTDGRPMIGSVKIGGSLRTRIVFDLPRSTGNFDVAMTIDNHLGQHVCVFSTKFQRDWPSVEREGEQMAVCDIPKLPLVPGDYKIKVYFSCADHIDRIEDVVRFTVVESDLSGTGKVPTDGFVALEHHWRLTDSGTTEQVVELAEATPRKRL